jgi:RimJ/RimL family protein N-acetyltransferase
VNHTATISTARLELVAATRAMLRADLSDAALLSALLTARLPEHWPPEFYDRRDMERYLAKAEGSAESVAWGLRYVVERPAAVGDARALVGVAAFGSPPTADGVVEIGYAIVPAARGKGYATEATLAMVAYGFSDPRVLTIEAETFPNLPASIRVLEKAGFARVRSQGESPMLRFVNAKSAV